MRRKLDVSLWEVKRFADEIVSFTQGKTLEEYKVNRGLQLITERLFTLLGEAMVRLRQSYPSDYGRILNAPPVARFRNQLVHQYDRMRDEEVWHTVTVRLPAMTAEVEKLLNEPQP